MVTELGRELVSEVGHSSTIRYRSIKMYPRYVLVAKRIPILRINSSVLKRNKCERIISFIINTVEREKYLIIEWKKFRSFYVCK